MRFGVAISSVCLALSAAAHAAPEGGVDWVYGDGELPEKWSIDNESYATCDAGAMQSPIDLDYANARGEIDVAGAYGMTTGTVKTGPGKVQLDMPPGMGMISGDRLFNLLQFHLHTPSEHRMNGRRYPLTAHLVHATAAGEFAVLGLMFEEGETNPALSELLRAIESGNTQVSLDMGDLVPEELDVYRYMGSLTTPPCTEGVNWHVVSEVVEADSDQIAAFENLLGQSARSMQPLNGRLVVAPGE